VIQCSERAVRLQAADAFASLMGSALCAASQHVPPPSVPSGRRARTLARAFRDDRSTAFHANNLTGTWKADRCRVRSECRRSSTQ
jgi:hypothetical protein